jgi:hypothetical protein
VAHAFKDEPEPTDDIDVLAFRAFISEGIERCIEDDAEAYKSDSGRTISPQELWELFT